MHSHGSAAAVVLAVAGGERRAKKPDTLETEMRVDVVGRQAMMRGSDWQMGGPLRRQIGE